MARSVIKEAGEKISSLTFEIIEAQSGLLDLGNRLDKGRTDTKRNIKNIARKICEKTKLSDCEIAEIMEQSLGNYMPEWVAYERRRKREEKKGPTLELID